MKKRVTQDGKNTTTMAKITEEECKTECADDTKVVPPPCPGLKQMMKDNEVAQETNQKDNECYQWVLDLGSYLFIFYQFKIPGIPLFDRLGP